MERGLVKRADGPGWGRNFLRQPPLHPSRRAPALQMRQKSMHNLLANPWADEHPTAWQRLCSCTCMRLHRQTSKAEMVGRGGEREKEEEEEETTIKLDKIKDN